MNAHDFLGLKILNLDQGVTHGGSMIDVISLGFMVSLFMVNPMRWINRLLSNNNDMESQPGRADALEI